MHRIDGAGATSDNRFTDGDPASATAATVVTDDWLNAVQEEIVSVISDSAVTPAIALDKTQTNQLVTAIKRIISASAIAYSQATETVLGVMKVATQTQVNTGSDDSTAVTPKKLLNGVASSNGVTSYRKTASWQDGGTIRSSGTAQTTSTGRVVVTLPLAFADTNYVITCSSQSSGAGFPGWSVEVNKGARTTSTFEVGTFTSSAAAAANVPFQWTAEGKAP